jgi:hypothetical protein
MVPAAAAPRIFYSVLFYKWQQVEAVVGQVTQAVLDLQAAEQQVQEACEEEHKAPVAQVSVEMEAI